MIEFKLRSFFLCHEKWTPMETWNWWMTNTQASGKRNDFSNQLNEMKYFEKIYKCRFENFKHDSTVRNEKYFCWNISFDEITSEKTFNTNKHSEIFTYLVTTKVASVIRYFIYININECVDLSRCILLYLHEELTTRASLQTHTFAHTYFTLCHKIIKLFFPHTNIWNVRFEKMALWLKKWRKKAHSPQVMSLARVSLGWNTHNECECVDMCAYTVALWVSVSSVNTYARNAITSICCRCGVCGVKKGVQKKRSAEPYTHAPNEQIETM